MDNYSDYITDILELFTKKNNLILHKKTYSDNYYIFLVFIFIIHIYYGYN